MKQRLFKGPMFFSSNRARALNEVPVAHGVINERDFEESAKARLFMERRRKGKDVTQGKPVDKP